MNNRIALVTGGMGDIGTAICQHFIELGAKVIAVDYVDKTQTANWQLQQKQLGFDIGVVYADVTQFESCAMMAKEVADRFGSVDILVNGAGITQDASFRKMTPEQWNKVVHTDLDSMFNVTKQFIDGMVTRGFGRVINISSVNGQKGQFGQTNYSSAKSGVYGFTKSLAQEVAKNGVTVNAISPGYVNSKMVMTVAENIREQIIATIPAGRLAKPEEIAWAIGFLAAERSAFITGINLPVNGGLHMY